MPERTTIVGKELSYDFDHCNETFCSEKNITYDAPLPQLNLLVDKSPSCSQMVTFECQSAPVMVSYLFIPFKIEKVCFFGQILYKDTFKFSFSSFSAKQL
jgi:hypothetical protein